MAENEKGVVGFMRNTKTLKSPTFYDSSRVDISCSIPETFKSYFFPKNEWSSYDDKINVLTDFYPVGSLSGTMHGMLTAGYPYSKSPYYTAPYLLYFRTRQHGIEPNYLSFNDFLLPPSYNHILALLNYDEITDKFVPSFNADVRLPYQNVLSLNSVLEFYITDSNGKLVEFKDLSQLFISIQIL